MMIYLTSMSVVVMSVAVSVIVSIISVLSITRWLNHRRATLRFTRSVEMAWRRSAHIASVFLVDQLTSKIRPIRWLIGTAQEAQHLAWWHLLQSTLRHRRRASWRWTCQAAFANSLLSISLLGAVLVRHVTTITDRNSDTIAFTSVRSKRLFFVFRQFCFHVMLCVLLLLECHVWIWDVSFG